MSETVQSVTPPYISYVTFKNTIQTLSLDGKMPRQIDHSVLGTLGGSMRKNFMAALRFFKLIDDSGKPADGLRKLASANEAQWKEFIGVLLEEHYPEQINQLADASPNLLRDSFVKSFGDFGSSVVQPAIRFLLIAARDAGIPVSSHLGQRKVRSANGARRKPRKETRHTAIPEEEMDQPVSDKKTSFRASLLEKFPSFDPSWQAEQQQAWFSAYQKLLGMHNEPGQQ